MNQPNRSSALSESIPETSSIENALGFSRILVVDDDKLLRALISESLTECGYRVDCAENGEAAWDMICKEDYDLLITDHNMPLLTGMELLRRLQSSPYDLPAIMISGYMPANSPDFNQLIGHGAALAKPFSLTQLTMMIQTVLNSQSSAK